MSSLSQPNRLAVDAGNGQASLLLSVAGVAAIALLGLELEYFDLLAAVVLVHRAVTVAHPQREYDLGLAVATDQQNAINGDIATCIGCEALDGDAITFRDAILLAAGFDDGVLLFAHVPYTCRKTTHWRAHY